jgi:3-phenylpropionate/trans-cinnamate dioxygenase ferredoxin subunit
VSTTGTRLCALDDLTEGVAARIELDGRVLAVVRLGDDVYVIGDRCSHADVSLSEGEVDEHTCTIECPKHGSEFDLRTGEPRSLPAVRPVPRYEAHVVAGDVLVDLTTEAAS